MSQPQTSALRKIFLAAWGMVTLILFFCVILLTNQLERRGQIVAIDTVRTPNPAPATAVVPQALETTAETREVSLYFASPDGSALTPERQGIPLGDSTIDNCRAVLEFLIRGPRGGLARILPNSTTIRGIYLIGQGEVVLDFEHGFEAEVPASASVEALMVYGIVNTLGQPGIVAPGDPAIRSVQFLFNGAEPTDRFPVHLDLSGPIHPNASWTSTDASPGRG